jgi:hypothetical protein
MKVIFLVCTTIWYDGNLIVFIRYIYQFKKCYCCRLTLQYYRVINKPFCWAAFLMALFSSQPVLNQKRPTLGCAGLLLIIIMLCFDF